MAKITKPSTIRNLALVSPEGSLVAVWQDKKDIASFFVAKTTKTAGWTNFKKRSDLIGPMTAEKALAFCAKAGKVGVAALEELESFIEAQATEIVEVEIVDETPAVVTLMAAEILGDQAGVPGVEQITLDEEYAVLCERAAGRTAERNQELVIELKAEIKKLATREDIEPTKRAAMTERKLKMVVACEGAARA